MPSSSSSSSSSWGEIRYISGRSYFPQLINLSISDFSSAISYWFTVAAYGFCYGGEEIKIYNEDLPPPLWRF